MATAHRSRAVVVFLATVVVAIGLVVFQLRVAAADGPVRIPGEGDGYQITKADSSQKAPSGFEGRTDTSTQTAVGNTPATMGKKVVAHFTLSNQIKTCPAADGAAEGEGVFSMTVDSTDAQASGTSTLHIEMRAKAKYKGQVSDDANLDTPVKAEIDYTYVLSGTIRDANGAIATPAGSNVAQHVTIQFGVGRGLTAPSIGAFAGGDPTQGRYSEAFSVGTALAYWAGVYYSVAQTQWRSGLCVQISFNPPSNTVQPALGTEAKVKAEVTTKSGERVPARFHDVHAFEEGRVSPSAGVSTEASPLTFTYTAPNRKPNNPSLAGFQVDATSRAGIAEQSWHTNLGTDWSGQISCSRIDEGDVGNTEQQSWSAYAATRLTFDVKDAVGKVNGYSEVNNWGQNLRPVARQGYVFDNSSSMSGIVADERDVRIVVTFNETRKTYSISPEHLAMRPGQMHSVTCNHQNGCFEQDLSLSVAPCLPPLEGPLTNRNELHGSMNDVKTGLGRSRKGTQTWTVEWHLARQGTSR